MANTNASARVSAAGNPFTGMTLAQMKRKWSSMSPAQRKANVENFRSAAEKAPAPKKKPVAKKPVAKKPALPNRSPQSTSTPTKSKASDKAVPGGYTISPSKRKPGSRGVAQQPKPKKQNPRAGSRAQAKRARDTAGRVRKTIGKVGRSLGKLSDSLKLTRKAGEVFTVGNMRYVSDGKGGIRSSQRMR